VVAVPQLSPPKARVSHPLCRPASFGMSAATRCRRQQSDCSECVCVMTEQWDDAPVSASLRLRCSEYEPALLTLFPQFSSVF
jgi:hypothetical protein